MVIDADAAEGVAARNGDGVLEETLAEERVEEREREVKERGGECAGCDA